MHLLAHVHDGRKKSLLVSPRSSIHPSIHRRSLIVLLRLYKVRLCGVCCRVLSFMEAFCGHHEGSRDRGPVDRRRPSNRSSNANVLWTSIVGSVHFVVPAIDRASLGDRTRLHHRMTKKGLVCLSHASLSLVTYSGF